MEKKHMMGWIHGPSWRRGSWLTTPSSWRCCIKRWVWSWIPDTETQRLCTTGIFGVLGVWWTLNLQRIGVSPPTWPSTSTVWRVVFHMLRNPGHLVRRGSGRVHGGVHRLWGWNIWNMRMSFGVRDPARTTRHNLTSNYILICSPDSWIFEAGAHLPWWSGALPLFVSWTALAIDWMTRDSTTHFTLINSLTTDHKVLICSLNLWILAAGALLPWWLGTFPLFVAQTTLGIAWVTWDSTTHFASITSDHIVFICSPHS